MTNAASICVCYAVTASIDAGIHKRIFHKLPLKSYKLKPEIWDMQCLTYTHIIYKLI